MPCWDHNAKKSPPFRRVFALWPQAFYSLEGRTPPNLPASSSPPKEGTCVLLAKSPPP